MPGRGCLLYNDVSNVDVDYYQHTEYCHPPLGYSGAIGSKSYDCLIKNFHFSVGLGGDEEECEDVYYVYDGRVLKCDDDKGKRN